MDGPGGTGCSNSHSLAAVVIGDRSPVAAADLFRMIARLR
jgi:hypothetical protein